MELVPKRYSVDESIAPKCVQHPAKIGQTVTINSLSIILIQWNCELCSVRVRGKLEMGNSCRHANRRHERAEKTHERLL